MHHGRTSHGRHTEPEPVPNPNRRAKPTKFARFARQFDGRHPSAKGPAEWFTGDVWIDAIARGEEPSRIRVSAVRFMPGARTAWHSHAVGQIRYVTDGAGLVQSRGGDIVGIRSGDIVRAHITDAEYRGDQP